MEWIKQNKGFLVLTLFSLLWVSGAVCLLALEIKKEDFYSRDMSLNELGDYLAGAFSPLAFLWLIYGYFMQNIELKAQIIEFRKNVALTQEQISQTERLEEDRVASYKRSCQPRFIFRTDFLSNSEYEWSDEIIAYSSSALGSAYLIKAIDSNESDKIISENEKIDIPIKIKSLKNDSYTFILINPYFRHPNNLSQSIGKSVFKENEEIECNVYLDKNGVKKLLLEERIDLTIMYVDINSENHSLKLEISLSPYGLGFYINDTNHTYFE